jgi:uncharacterized damage-inducible protein DinB
MRKSLLLLTAATLLSVPAAAQQPQLVTDLIRDIEQVERKMMGLAKAMPADKYDWRPGQGVRSFGDVVLHVAADNYLIPAAIGIAPDASTGIKGDDYKTAVAFEQRKLSTAERIAEMEKSFAFVKEALKGTSNARLSEKAKLFGQEFTVQQVWILATTHLHEHLGQVIAYARSNNVVPPWSQ